MTVRLQTSLVVDRPVSKVFDFMAINHVRNHPRWDPDIQLEQLTAGPIGAGTVIRRRNSRSGTTIEGTMEVFEFVPNQSMGMIIHDGPAVMNGWLNFNAAGENQTKVTTIIELPGMDESADTSFLIKALERRDQKIKQLLEAET